MQTGLEEIILGCTGGRCPIKISCVTFLRQDATTKISPPFVQVGMQIKCSYLKLKEYERRIPEKIVEHKTEQEAKSVEEDKAILGEEKPAVQTVAANQGQLFE